MNLSARPSRERFLQKCRLRKGGSSPSQLTKARPPSRNWGRARGRDSTGEGAATRVSEACLLPYLVVNLATKPLQSINLRATYSPLHQAPPPLHRPAIRVRNVDRPRRSPAVPPSSTLASLQAAAPTRYRLHYVHHPSYQIVSRPALFLQKAELELRDVDPSGTDPRRSRHPQKRASLFAPGCKSTATLPFPPSRHSKLQLPTISRIFRPPLPEAGSGLRSRLRRLALAQAPTRRA